MVYHVPYFHAQQHFFDAHQKRTTMNEALFEGIFNILLIKHTLTFRYNTFFVKKLQLIKNYYKYKYKGKH